MTPKKPTDQPDAVQDTTGQAFQHRPFPKDHAEAAVRDQVRAARARAAGVDPSVIPAASVEVRTGADGVPLRRAAYWPNSQNPFNPPDQYTERMRLVTSREQLDPIEAELVAAGAKDDDIRLIELRQRRDEFGPVTGSK